MQLHVGDFQNCRVGMIIHSKITEDVSDKVALPCLSGDYDGDLSGL